MGLTHTNNPVSGSSCSILLVEDNNINQKVVTIMLSKLGLVPEIADRGERAIELVKEKAFDLILMDLHMPGMHGVEAARRIRELLGDQCPPIVALTADVVRGNEEEVQEQGLDGFLTKPISVDRLRECIREHTGKAFE